VHSGPPGGGTWTGVAVTLGGIFLAAAITFGVLFASPLTLLFTPCALELQGRFYDWRARRRAGRRASAEPAQAE